MAGLHCRPFSWHSGHVKHPIAAVDPDVWNRAVSVFDTEDKAALWLATPVPELGGHTPEEALNRPEGHRDVMAILDRIDYVVYG